MRRLEELRKQVDKQLRQIAIVRDTIEGRINLVAYERYLATVAHQYAPHSPIVMTLAASRCNTTHRELSEYLIRHAIDERDHNEWAAQDLRSQRVSVKSIAEAHAVPACKAMIGFTYYVAGFDNPVGIFGWMYILEAVGADLGPDAARGLERAGIQAQFVAGHSVADQQHTQEIADQVKKYVKTPSDKRAVEEAAEVSADLYVRMFHQVEEAAARGTARRRGK